MSETTERQEELEEQYADTQVLLGVAYREEPTPAREFDVAAAAVETGLWRVQTKLTELRQEREELRLEIKRLVTEEERLVRMFRIASTIAEEAPSGEPE